MESGPDPGKAAATVAARDGHGSGSGGGVHGGGSGKRSWRPMQVRGRRLEADEPWSAGRRRLPAALHKRWPE